MKTLLIATLALVPAWGQALEINLDAIAAKAKEKAEITLEGSALAEAQKAAPESLRGSLTNLSRVLVRHYEFSQKGAFSDADLDAIRKQVGSGSGWTRVVNVKDEEDTVEIYMLTQSGKPGGFLLIAAEEKELTVVNVIGSLELAKLQELVTSTIQYDLANAAKKQESPNPH